MKRTLVKSGEQVYYYKDGKRIDGVHEKISGDVSGIHGNVDTCDITAEERKLGIDIEELIEK